MARWSMCSTRQVVIAPDQFILYVFQAATGQRARVAVLTLPGTGGNASGIGAMAFSPDGSRIAYVGGGALSASVYIATVP